MNEQTLQAAQEGRKMSVECGVCGSRKPSGSLFCSRCAGEMTTPSKDKVNELERIMSFSAWQQLSASSQRVASEASASPSRNRWRYWVGGITAVSLLLAALPLLFSGFTI
ncbi:MAG: hypothetical protein JWQ73_267 [Variovorax sp.]|jgi:hypothetical protein|nr:hypothetical protein [Variovorax sp.]